MSPAGRAMLTADELGIFADQLLSAAAGARAVGVLSTDGMLLASAGMNRDEADVLAATACGFIALGRDGSSRFNLKEFSYVLVGYTDGQFVMCAVNDRCVLAVLTRPGARCEPVLYEMRRFAESYADVISPDVRATMTAPTRA